MNLDLLFQGVNPPCGDVGIPPKRGRFNKRKHEGVL